MPRGTQVKRDGLAITVEKRHLKQSCSQEPKLPLAPCPVCKGPHWRRDCPQRCLPQGSGSRDNQNWRCLGVPTQAPIIITPEEPRVLITVGGQSVDFLLDTGATFSVLTEAPGPLSSWSTTVMGLLGPAKCYYFSHPLSCSWDSVLFSHQFLIMQESPSPLLGRDILSKIQASVFMNVEPALSFPLIEQNVNPKLWTNGKMVDWAQNAVPVIIKLKDPHLFPRQKQYPLKPKVKERLKPIIEHLKEQGLLIPWNSPCNTPILGVKKSNDKWKLVQDLWIINEAVVPFTRMPKTNGFSCL